MFLQASVILSTGREYLTRYLPGTRNIPQVPPRPGTPPGTRYNPPGTRYTPWDQPGIPPGTSYPPPRTRYTPWDQVHPQTRYTPWTRYTRQDLVQPPWDQVHPLGPARYTPWDQLPSPLDQVHPLGPGTPPWTRYTPGPGTPPTRYTPHTRYTPGHRACWEIRSTRGGTHPTGMQSCLANFFPKTAWR